MKARSLLLPAATFDHQHEHDKIGQENNLPEEVVQSLRAGPGLDALEGEVRDETEMHENGRVGGQHRAEEQVEVIAHETGRLREVKQKH